MIAECAPRTLVVDDDVEMHKAIEFGLGDELSVDFAQSGEEAIGMARQRHFPVVILDLSLPVLSGLETMEMLRAAWRYHKFIILTGYPDTSSAINALNGGAFRHFVKPLKFNLLREAVLLAHCSYEKEVSGEIVQTPSLKGLKGLGLTPRETDVAAGILQNKANEAIARDLNISVRTAEKHCQMISENWDLFSEQAQVGIEAFL